MKYEREKDEETGIVREKKRVIAGNHLPSFLPRYAHVVFTERCFIAMHRVSSSQPREFLIMRRHPTCMGVRVHVKDRNLV